MLTYVDNGENTVLWLNEYEKQILCEAMESYFKACDRAFKKDADENESKKRTIIRKRLYTLRHLEHKLILYNSSVGRK